jgi:hypothetical protein
MRKRIVWLLSLTLLSSYGAACVAKNVVVKIPQTQQSGLKKDGLFYALPRTIVSVEIPVEKEVRKKGRFEPFAACFFPQEEKAGLIQHENKSSFSLGDPAISTSSEPDPEEVFMVKTKGPWHRFFEDKAIEMDWNEEGIMTKGSAETTNKTIDFITQAAGLATSLVTRAVAAGVSGSVTDAEGQTAAEEQESEDLEAEIQEVIKKWPPDCQKHSPELQDLLNKFRSLLKAKKERQKAEADFAGTPSLENKTKAEKAKKIVWDARAAIDLSELIAAIDIYKEIKSLLESRVSLLKSDKIADLRTQLEEVDKQITSYKTLFLGTVTNKAPWNARFEILPNSHGWPGRDDGHWPGTEKTFHLFNYAKDKGVCGVLLEPEVSFLNLSIGDGFQAEEGKVDCGDARMVSLLLKPNAKQMAASVNTAFTSNSEDGERGFRYRLPVTVAAIVREANAQISYAQIPVAQLGLVASLPSSTGGRKTKYDLELYPTGALKNFTLGSTALLTSSNVTDVSGAVGTVLDARIAARNAAAKAAAAAATAESDIIQAQNLRDLLLACQKIREAQVALGRTDAPLPKYCSP